ncbi:hypothetical protein HOP62_14800 [Halomonas sp. MCCC 1A17488]|uniref:Uncharacterized protein n=1 Tax=Billgrantia sulfidoxydans TaxID=2733484 RepID=A0ABX7WA23_9GAMM|nr:MULTISPECIES: hypothetical protein [Halomonas]MCE8017346.1 hypothetical protein [Halomonas sp. MCCC 1A17488]MCG3240679.1 hypothetical protein [Halomonas sp. MCCC 1A17488]QPP49481.1 hypothetical protein I4484_20340 [Halomonas sp. SS10-MC5]QTP56836.1 hypothetical protein HNO51_20425 [Halomonas sulfidoxydans]
MTTRLETVRRLPAAAWVLGLLLAALLMLGLVPAYHLMQARSEAPLFRVVVDGETLLLDAETHADLGRELDQLASGLDLRLRDEMRPWLEVHMNAAFVPLEAAVPEYLDWHFSLQGSYLRLAMALTGELDAWLEAQLAERLIERSGFEAALVELETDYATRLELAQRRLEREVALTLHARYGERQAVATSSREIREVDLDLALRQAFRHRLDEMRWGTAAAGGAFGVAVGRTLAQRLVAGTAMQGSRAMAARVVARLGGHATRSLGSGATAAAAASPTGPAALLAGATATAVALAGFVGTEYTLLKAEELRFRDAMEAELAGEVARTRVEVRRALEADAARRAEALERYLTQAAHDVEAGAGVPQEYRILVPGR